jgi:N-acetylglucosaminyl-diphospho-decaprenol L-rhamnosyltransferase
MLADARGADITVISVTYNGATDIVDALRSAEVAAERAGLSVELIVVDNASTDASVATVREAFGAATVVENSENVGFGRANNQAFDLASGRRWLLLNPDARLHPDALTVLVAAMDQLGAAAVAPSIGRSGAESAGMAPSLRSIIGHFLFVNRFLSGDRGGAWRGVQLRRSAAAAPRPVDWASAAALLLDPAAVRAVHGFDERYFLYGEDVDLGIRLARAGHHVWLVPEATAEHAIAGSQGGVSSQWVAALHRLCRTDGDGVRLLAIGMAMALGLTVRAVAAHARRRSPDGRLHAARMRAAARRAWSLTLGSGA